MDIYADKIKDYLLELEYDIVHIDSEDSLFVVQKEEAGISNLIIDCESPIVVIEQYLFDLKADDVNVFKKLLIKNREIIHGAFVLDTTGKKVLFRDTLQIENLDLNELRGTLNSLELLLSEYSNQIIKFSKN